MITTHQIKAPDTLPASITPQSHFAYYMPEYLEDFGWSPYVEGLKADRATLKQLVAMPSDHIANTWPEGRNIEQGLQVVDTFFRNYLYDANYLVISAIMLSEGWSPLGEKGLDSKSSTKVDFYFYFYFFKQNICVIPPLSYFGSVFQVFDTEFHLKGMWMVKVELGI